MEVKKENREEIENEFLALVLNKPEVIDLMQITPEMLTSRKRKIIFQCAINCYREIKYIDLTRMVAMTAEFDIDYFTTLFCDTMWHPKAWKEQLESNQKQILDLYKRDVIDYLNKQFKENKITITKYFEKIKHIESLDIQTETSELTKQEIIESINEEKARINLNQFEKLNNILKLVQGDFLIIGATTGAGKSGLLLNLMNDLMNTYQCIYFNMEMSKSTIYKRIISINANLRIADVEHPKTEYQRGLIEASLQKIEDAKIIVEHKAANIQEIKSIVAKKKAVDKHTIIFIDHIGLVKYDKNKSLYEQATEVAKELRQLCLDYDCTIISASQLNRNAYGNDKLTLNMLKDSGELENSASKVMLLYPDKNTKKEDLTAKMIFDIAKNRDGYTGIVTTIYEKDKQIFKEE